MKEAYEIWTFMEDAKISPKWVTCFKDTMLLFERKKKVVFSCKTVFHLAYLVLVQFYLPTYHIIIGKMKLKNGWFLLLFLLVYIIVYIDLVIIKLYQDGMVGIYRRNYPQILQEIHLAKKNMKLSRS